MRITPAVVATAVIAPDPMPTVPQTAATKVNDELPRPAFPASPAHAAHRPLLAAAVPSAFGAPAGPDHSHAEPPEPADTDHVTVVERDGYRYITSDGLPDHTPARFRAGATPTPSRPRTTTSGSR